MAHPRSLEEVRLGIERLMAQMTIKPGWVQRIVNGEILEPAKMEFCTLCKLWHVDNEHDLKYHTEPVEPGVKEKQVGKL